MHPLKGTIEILRDMVVVGSIDHLYAEDGGHNDSQTNSNNSEATTDDAGELTANLARNSLQSTNTANNDGS